MSEEIRATVPEDLYDAYMRLAELEERSLSSIVRRVLRAHLERSEAPASRPRLREEQQAAVTGHGPQA